MVIQKRISRHSQKFLLFLGLILLMNCKKENFHEPDNFFSVSDAKAWFINADISSIEINWELTKPMSHANKISFKPLWEKASLFDRDSLSIYEVPITLTKKLGFNVIDVNDKNNLGIINGRTTLLLIKNKSSGEISSKLLHYFLADDTAAVNSNINLQNIDNNFDGFVFVTDFRLNIQEGIKVKNGYTIAVTKSSKNGILNDKRPPNQNPECLVVITDYFERECTEFTDGTTSCTDWKYIGSETTTLCYQNDEDSDDGGGAGGGNNKIITTETVIQSKSVDDSLFSNAPKIVYNYHAKIIRENGDVTSVIVYPMTVKDPVVNYLDTYNRNTTRSLTLSDIKIAGLLWEQLL